MTTSTRHLVVALLSFGLVAMTVASAEAGKKYYRKNGGNFAAGVATGLIIGGIIAGGNRRGGYYCFNGFCNGRAYGPRRVYGPRPYYVPQPIYRAAPVYRGRLNRAHVNYCFSKYRSYRVSDNTFQPYHGPRKPCRSPY